MKQITLVALLGVAALQGTTMGVWAQTAPTMPATKQDAKVNLHYFRLKNVQPSLMAYWIDPDHNPLPNDSDRDAHIYGSLKQYWPDATLSNEKEERRFKLPANVGRAIASDEHDVLSVEVDDADVEPLRELLNSLDQPLRRIEIEAQFVEMDKADLKKFDLDIALGNDNHGMSAGLMGDNFASTLNELVAQNKVKIIAAPRVNAVDNVIAQLGDSERRPILSKSNAMQARLEFSTNKLWLNIEPTINPDNSLALRYRAFRQTYLSAVEKSGQGQIAGVSDGATFVIRNPLLSNKSETQSARETVVFVTPRIVHKGR